MVGVSRSEPRSETVDEWCRADVATAEGRNAVVAHLEERGGGLDVLVNNAGRGLQAPWTGMTEDDLRTVLELNFFAPVLLTQVLYPFLRSSQGSVINVSSVAGKAGIPFMGGYCASKFALTAFSESLRGEADADGVRVLNLTVGRIATGFGTNVLGDWRAPSTHGVASAERLARIAVRAWRHRRRDVVFPAWYRPAIWLAKLFPVRFGRLARKKWEGSNLA